MANKDMHGYDALFIPSLDKKYSCPVCLAALRDPVQTSCGHRFCQACLKMSFSNKKKGRCPVDKKWCNTATDVFPDIAVKREILSLMVKCYNHIRECDWIGELRDLKTHTNQCPKTEVNCDLCKKLMMREELVGHKVLCPRRLEKCSHCGAPVVYVDMPKHQLLVCNKFPVNCVICCETGILREDIPKHVDTAEGDCPLVTVPCKFQHMGCYFQDKRKNMTNHYETSGEHHLMLLSTVVAQNEETISHHSRLVSELTDDMVNLQAVVEEQKRIIDCQDELLANQETKLQDLLQTNHSGSILWKVKGTQNRESNWQVESPSFYTGCPGYKVKMVLDCRGHCENNKKYASLYLYLEAGQYDEIMTFPFQGRCNVAMINEDMLVENGSNVVFKAQGNMCERDSSGSNLTGKKMKFYCLSKLQEKRFSQDGVLIEVKVNHVIC